MISDLKTIEFSGVFDLRTVHFVSDHAHILAVNLHKLQFLIAGMTSNCRMMYNLQLTCRKYGSICELICNPNCTFTADCSFSTIQMQLFCMLMAFYSAIVNCNSRVNGPLHTRVLLSLLSNFFTGVWARKTPFVNFQSFWSCCQVTKDSFGQFDSSDHATTLIMAN